MLSGWNTAKQAVVNGVGRQHLTRKFFAKYSPYIMYDLRPPPPLRRLYVNLRRRLGAGEKYNARKHGDTHFRVWSFDMDRWKERRKKKQMKYRSNGVVYIAWYLPDNLFSDRLFLFSFLPFSFVSNRNNDGLIERRRSIFDHFERKRSKEIGDKSVN